jgi:hypothetical protein
MEPTQTFPMHMLKKGALQSTVYLPSTPGVQIDLSYFTDAKRLEQLQTT